MTSDLEPSAYERLAGALDESVPLLIEIVCSDLEDRLLRRGRPDLHVEKESVVASEVEH